MATELGGEPVKSLRIVIFQSYGIKRLPEGSHDLTNTSYMAMMTYPTIGRLGKGEIHGENRIYKSPI